MQVLLSSGYSAPRLVADLSEGHEGMRFVVYDRWQVGVLRDDAIYDIGRLIPEPWRGTRVDTLGTALNRYHLLYATRAELLRALGRTAEAREADLRAIALTANPAERALLQERIGLH